MFNIPTSQQVALLIDADNVQLSRLKQILQVSEDYGKKTICRAYGDWKKPPLSSFRSQVRKLNIETIQVNRRGKDTTDKKLMIDCAKLLGEQEIDTFIIASGDADFKLLIETIKEENRRVIGIGNKKQTAPKLEKICDAFHYIEDLEELLARDSRIREFKALVFRTLTSSQPNKAGWVYMGWLGKKMCELDPEYKSRLKIKKLSSWLNKLTNFLEVEGQMVRVINRG